MMRNARVMRPFSALRFIVLRQSCDNPCLSESIFDFSVILCILNAWAQKEQFILPFANIGSIMVLFW